MCVYVCVYSKKRVIVYTYVCVYSKRVVVVDKIYGILDSLFRKKTTRQACEIFDVVLIMV